MEYIIYQITHRQSGMYYIGQTTTHKWNKGYMGSGARIKKAVKQHGKHMFHRAILYKTTSHDDVIARERKFIDWLDPMSYNMREGGAGSKNAGKKLPQATIERMKAGQRARRERDKLNPKPPETPPTGILIASKSWITTPRTKALTAEQKSGFYPAHSMRYKKPKP